MRPVNVLRDFGADGPPTWAHAADVVERELGALVSEDGHGDAHGWADGHRLAPAPRESAVLLREVIRAIEPLAGAIDQPPHAALPDAIRELPPDDVEALTACARRLRWLRGDPPDALQWGFAMGRLRWASFLLRRSADALADAVDPLFVPDAPWAAFARAATPRGAPVRDRDAMRLAAPQPGAGEGDVLRWIAHALDSLRSAEIVAALRPIKDVVVGIAEERIPHSDRRLRRRLRDIKERLAAPAAQAHDAAAPNPSRASEPDLAPAVPIATTPEPTTAERELAALRDRVRAWTAGKRALFVSNREDPALRARLEDLLGLSIDWAENTPRRIESSTRAVASGAYDFVLSATGFSDHCVDAALVRACRTGGARYIRVDRGRPVACLRALARDVAGAGSVAARD